MRTVDAGRNARRIIEAAVRQWVPRGSAILVAVSGGVDSITLLDAVMAAYGSDPRKKTLRIEVAHVDHASRPSSGGDADAVARIVASLPHVMFHHTRLDPLPAGHNAEAMWREARYRYFEQLRTERGLDFILTGHNRDDLVETVVWRLTANRELRIPSLYDERRHLIRPLLTVDRPTILTYAQSKGLVWQEDPTNTDITYTRNRIRHEVLPFLEDKLGDVKPRLADQGRRLEADAAFLWSVAQREAAVVLSEVVGSKPWVHALTSVVASQPDPLRWRIVVLVLAPVVGFRIGPSHGERVVRFIQGSRGMLELPGGFQIRRYQGSWVIENIAARGPK